MKFKNSQFEVRYNSLWNDEVVSPYKLLIKHPEFKGKNFFSENYPSIESLLKKYCSGVINIVNNFERQMGNFQDKRISQKYLGEIKKQAIEDLDEFKAKIESRYKESSFLLSMISKTKMWLNDVNSGLTLTQIIGETECKFAYTPDFHDVSIDQEPTKQGFNEVQLEDLMYSPTAMETTPDSYMDIESDDLELDNPAWKF